MIYYVDLVVLNLIKSNEEEDDTPAEADEEYASSEANDPVCDSGTEDCTAIVNEAIMNKSINEPFVNESFNETTFAVQTCRRQVNESIKETSDSKIE